jgi:hypothetical protein
VTPWGHVVLEADWNSRWLFGEVGLIIRFLDEGFAHRITFRLISDLRLVMRCIVFVVLSASRLALAVSTPAPAQVDPASLAEQDQAAESRGDVAAALAL